MNIKPPTDRVCSSGGYYETIITADILTDYAIKTLHLSVFKQYLTPVLETRF